MMILPTIVFVDGSRVELAAGATALDAVRSSNPDGARQVEEGARVITDSRGIPVANDAPLHGGAVFRLVAARESAEAEGEAPR